MAELLNIYQVKVCKYENRKVGEILNVQYYKHFENAMSDIINKSGDIFDDYVPDFFYEEEQTPRMRCQSEYEEGQTSDDFELFYDNAGICVFVGKILTMDD